MLPTPDWIGRKEAGMRPALISCVKNSDTYLPIRDVTSSGAVKPPTSSFLFVSTTATIFLGSTLSTGLPARSLAV